MKKYRFAQNNVGGKFVINNNVAEYVIIEAENSEKATEKFMSILENNDDSGYGDYCPCCGDRWCYDISEYDVISDDEIAKLITTKSYFSNTVVEYLNNGKVNRFLKDEVKTK